MLLPKFKVGDIVRTIIDGTESKYMWFQFPKVTLLLVEQVLDCVDLSGRYIYKYKCRDCNNLDSTQIIYEPDIEYVCSSLAAAIGSVNNSVLSKDAYQALTSSCSPKLKVVDGPSIKNIDVNVFKRIVTVVFENGHVEQVHCAEGDAFDVRIGVAIAIASAKFGSKSKFHKFVDKTQKFVGKEPKVIKKKVSKSATNAKKKSK